MAKEEEDINVNINVNTNNAEKKVDDLKDSLGELKEHSKGLPGAFEEITGGLQNFVSGIGSAIKASLAFIATPLGAVISAIVVGLGALKEAFTGSEEGQNKLAKITAVASAIFEKFTDILQFLGEKLIWVFENPKQALLDFVELVKTNIINRFTGLLELIPKLGTAIKQLFSGDFSGAAKTAADAVGKVTLGIESVTDSLGKAGDAIAEFAREAEKAAKIAAGISDQRAKADKIDRDLITATAEANAKAAALREKASDKEKVSLKERKAALIEAGEIERDILSKQQAALKLRLDALEKEGEIVDQTKEYLTEVAKAKAAVIDIDAKIAESGKQTNKELIKINREAAAEAKELAAEKKAIADKAEAEKKAADKKAEEEKKKADEEIKKAAEAQADAIKQARDLKTAQIEDENEREKETLKNKYLDDLAAIEVQGEAKANLEIELANKLTQDLAKIDEKAAEDKKKLKEEELQEDFDRAEKSLNAAQNLSDLIFSIKLANTKKGSKEEEEAAKKQFKVNKALGIAGALINGAQAAVKSLAQAPLAIGPVPSPVGIASLVAVVATTAASVAKIAATQFESSASSSSAPSTPSLGGGGNGETAEQKTFVSPELQKITNQQKDKGKGGTEPIKAYVMSSEITGVQDKNAVIERRASF